MADNRGASNQAVPESMRHMAETSLAQAKRAVEEYMAAAQRAMSAIEGSAQVAQAGARDVSRRAVGYAEQNVTAAFDFAERLVRAQDLRELISLQQEFLRTQMERFGAQMRELGEVAARTATESTRAGAAAAKPRR
ncbi:MAG TPA: TIGR01841 family phasin [Microvirga sp.]|nr:TIGR01841 family phasin [Microvirga sp.]